MELEARIKAAIRDVPDFPKPGILFKDITTLLEAPELSKAITVEFSERLKNKNIHAVAGIESRGFMYGFALAQLLNVPFVIIRKKGKLPSKVVSKKYELEYGTSEIEMHADAIKKGWNVVVHDDLLATGGTAAAAGDLIRSQEANIAAFAFVVELTFLDGRKKMEHLSENIISLASY